MSETQTTTETAVDPVCGKTVDTRKIQYTSRDDKGTHYFCSENCRQRFNAADAKTKKGFWAKYTDRLKNQHCTRTPPECR